MDWRAALQVVRNRTADGAILAFSYSESSLMLSTDGTENRTRDVGDRAEGWRRGRHNVLDWEGGLEFCRGDAAGISW